MALPFTHFAVSLERIGLFSVKGPSFTAYPPQAVNCTLLYPPYEKSYFS